ncbi:hypothetical protein K0U07_02240 [bacterium]|nr:hypothetical protein [bacterium]
MISRSVKTILSLTLATSCFLSKVAATETSGCHAIPPAQFPGGQNDLHAFVSASYILWQPYQTGMNIAVGQSSSDAAGSVVQPYTQAASGFKVAMEQNFEHDGWIGATTYTWYYHNPSLNTNTLTNGAVYVPTFDSGVSTYNSVQSKFKTFFNRIDATISRPQYIGHYVAYRPFGGALGAWDYQNLNFIAGTSSDGLVRQTANMKQDWWGIGPYGGMQGIFYLDNNFGLYFGAGGAILISSHHVKSSMTRVSSVNEVTTLVNNYNFTFYTCEPMIETSLGLSWEKDYEDVFLGVRVGWELQTYFSHNGFIKAYSPTGVRGDYSMQGLTVKAELNF